MAILCYCIVPIPRACPQWDSNPHLPVLLLLLHTLLPFEPYLPALLPGALVFWQHSESSTRLLWLSAALTTLLNVKFTLLHDPTLFLYWPVALKGF